MDDDIFDFYEYYANISLPAIEHERRLIQCASPLLLVSATVGNLLAFIVMRRLYHEVHAHCVYLAIAAVLDTVILYIRCGNEWLKSVTPDERDVSFDIMHSSTVACKTYTFAMDFVNKLNYWLLVCLAVETYVSTRRAASEATSAASSAGTCKTTISAALSRTRAIILLVIVLLSCLNVHYFWTWDKVAPMDEDDAETAAAAGGADVAHYKLCSLLAEFKDFDLYNQLINVMLLTDLLPPLLVIIFTLLAAIQLSRAACRQRGETAARQASWQKRYVLYSHAIRQLKRVILSVNTLFVLLTLPMSLKHLHYAIARNVGGGGDDSDDDMTFKAETEQRLVDTVCQMLHYCFLSGKFFVYVTLCAQFRHELRAIFRSKHLSADDVMMTNVASSLTDDHACATGATPLLPTSTFYRASDVAATASGLSLNHNVERVGKNDVTATGSSASSHGSGQRFSPYNVRQQTSHV